MHVCLFTSGWVDVLQLTARDIDPEDIAHGLSLTNRWNGATEQAVSVAWQSNCKRAASTSRRRNRRSTEYWMRCATTS